MNLATWVIYLMIQLTNYLDEKFQNALSGQ
jgi:hypothetical protein